MYSKFLIFLFFSGGLYAGTSKVSILLKSNDFIVGDLLTSKFQLESEYGLLNVDMVRIKEIKLHKKPKITFMNDDVLEAMIKASFITVNCEFGRINIDLSKVSVISKGPVALRNPKLKWSEAKDGLRLGISVNLKKYRDKKTLIVYSELINESSKEVIIRYPQFFDRVLQENAKLSNHFTIALYGTQNSLLEALEEVQMVEVKGPILKPGAKIIIESELDISNKELLERRKDIETRDHLPLKISKILHFRQKVKGYSPKKGKNFIHLLFRYGQDKEQTLLSPKVFWENKQ